MAQFYKHCMLHKTHRGQIGVSVQMTWIPEQFAHVGKVLALKDPSTGEWDDGWTVESVYARCEESYVMERSQDYKHQRKASDV